MERDFLGLNSKEALAVVKEEVNTDGSKDIGFAKGSGVQWPFSNKVTSAVPHFMNFKVAQEDKTRKIVSEPLMSSGFMSVPTADAYEYDPSKNRSTAEIQKSFDHDRQGGTHISLTTYSVQHDAHPMQRPHDVMTFPMNQAISVSVNNPFFKNHFATVGQNLGGANMKQQQLLGGIPVATTHSSLPTFGSVGEITEQCNGLKLHGSPAPLTIFYAGAVNVYEDVSPEKAQAIMLLAGNGSSIAPKTAQPKVLVQAPSSMTTAVNGVTNNQPISAPPCSGLPSPMSVSSHTGAQSGSGSTSTEEIKTTGVATTAVCKLEPPKTANAMGSVATTSTIPDGHPKFYAAFPQYRKASLASFLEKRKQRAMNAAPYVASKKSPECVAPDSNGKNISAGKAA